MFAFVRRLIGAALFNANTYEEVEADTRATPEALAVVLLASIGTGAGLGQGRIWATLVFSAVAVAAWIAWALLSYFIGVFLLPEGQTQADPGQLLRTLGYAQAPGMLCALWPVAGLDPRLAGFIFLWIIGTMVMAVRQALDFTSTARAIAVFLVGWILAGVAFGVIGVFFAAPVS